MKFIIRICLVLLLGGTVCSCESDSGDEIEKLHVVDTLNIQKPKILKFVFKSNENSQSLIEDVTGVIIGDSIIEFWVPYIMNSKIMKPHVEYEGDNIIWNDSINRTSEFMDFSTPVKLTICGKQDVKVNYYVYVHSFTGLPLIWIETEDRKEVLSKEEYVNGHMTLVENVVTRSPGSTIESDLKIKCRGWSSFYSAPKKSYRLKFDKKISLLDEPQDKAYVMIANYFDRTMIRNKIAYYMGDISDLDYSPQFHYVDMMLNGKYNGTYMLGDKLKISEDRVNVGKDGFLLEVDSDILRDNESDAVYFKTDSLRSPVTIKDPELTEGDENYNYIKEYVQEAEKTLFSDNFKDPNEGWQKYMDLVSFVDWFIINEIARNADSEAMGKSCYMNLKRGGKLKMGPIWDFDQSFGNQNAYPEYLPEGFEFEGRKVKWFTRLFQDPTFRKKAKERFYYFYGRKDDIFREINSNAQYIKYSVIENENKWHTINLFWPNVNRDVWGSYQNEVQYLKEWLNARFEWLKSAFDNIN